MKKRDFKHLLELAVVDSLVNKASVTRLLSSMESKDSIILNLRLSLANQSNEIQELTSELNAMKTNESADKAQL